jgi:hypothetical protein
MVIIRMMLISMKRGISNRTKRRTAMEGSMTMLQIFMNPSSTSRTISDEWAFPRADTICSLYMLLNTLDSPEAQERGQLSSLRHQPPTTTTDGVPDEVERLGADLLVVVVQCVDSAPIEGVNVESHTSPMQDQRSLKSGLQ